MVSEGLLGEKHLSALLEDAIQTAGIAIRKDSDFRSDAHIDGQRLFELTKQSTSYDRRGKIVGSGSSKRKIRLRSWREEFIQTAAS
jgi:hypothetical protein